jgi:hypothetical protein
MRRLPAWRWVLVLGVILGMGLAVVPSSAAVPEKKADGFDRLKSLVGEWEGTSNEGKPVHISYSLTAAGSALMESIDPGTDHSMVSLYHRDGQKLMMTHYCAAGNQPRMKAGDLSADGHTLAFSYMDATNLAKPADPHMVKLVLSFPDDDHLTQEWTFRAGGKDSPTVFQLARKK